MCVCARLIRALYLANWLARYPLGLAEKNNNNNNVKKKTVMPCCVAPITKTSYIADAAVSLSLLSPPSLSSTSFASLRLSHLSIVCLCL